MQVKGKVIKINEEQTVVGYTIEQVGCLIGRSSQCIQYWYKWASLNPDDPLTKELPEYIQLKPNSTRYWTAQGVKKLQAFKKKIPVGRPKKGSTKPPLLQKAIFNYYHKEEQSHE